MFVFSFCIRSLNCGEKGYSVIKIYFIMLRLTVSYDAPSLKINSVEDILNPQQQYELVSWKVMNSHEGEVLTVPVPQKGNQTRTFASATNEPHIELGKMEKSIKTPTWFLSFQEPKTLSRKTT